VRLARDKQSLITKNIDYGCIMFKNIGPGKGVTVTDTVIYVECRINYECKKPRTRELSISDRR
jgi:hypothetical protein